MIIGFIGNMGSGKTLSLVKEAYALYRKGYTIFSNINLSFPHEEYNIQDLLAYAENQKTFYKSVFILDEAHIFLDARTSISKINRALSYWLLMSRKADIILLYTTQQFRNVDIRLRKNTDIIVECKRKEIKNKGIMFIMNYIMIIELDGIREYKIAFIPTPYFKLYNTNEIVKNIGNL